jgi:hypothetical protein
LPHRKHAIVQVRPFAPIEVVFLQPLRARLRSLRIPWFVCRGSSHRALLHLGQIRTSGWRGTHRWPHRRQVNVGMRSFTMA